MNKLNKLNKLNKWLPVLGGLLLVDLFLARGYSQTSGEIAKLEAQLQTADQAVTKLTFLQQDVQATETELVAAKAQLTANEALFPLKVDALEIVGLAVASARESSVEFTSFQQLPPATEKLANTLGLYKHRLVAKGRLSSLGLLMSQIEARAKPTWRIDDVSLEPAGGDIWKASFNIVVVARPEGGTVVE